MRGNSSASVKLVEFSKIIMQCSIRPYLSPVHCHLLLEAQRRIELVQLLYLTDSRATVVSMCNTLVVDVLHCSRRS